MAAGVAPQGVAGKGAQSPGGGIAGSPCTSGRHCHIFSLCWLVQVSSGCLTASFTESKKINQTADGHAPNSLQEADFSVVFSAAGLETNKYYLEQHA